MMAVKPAPAVKKLVVLEEGVLISLANQPNFLKHFPFLKALKGMSSTKTSACCGAAKKANDARVKKLQQAKQTIGGMADDRKRLLKKLLNTKKARVSYKNGKKIVNHTF